MASHQGYTKTTISIKMLLETCCADTEINIDIDGNDLVLSVELNIDIMGDGRKYKMGS